MIKISSYALAVIMLFISMSHAAVWSLEIDKDPMSEEVYKYLKSSEFVSPNCPLNWPHQNVKARLWFSCQTDEFIIQNSANNLTDGDPGNGFSEYLIRVKNNDHLHWRKLTQPWGTDFLYLAGFGHHQIKKMKTLLIELPHFSDGPRVYQFDISRFEWSLCK